MTELPKLPDRAPYLLGEKLGENDNIFSAVNKSNGEPCVIKFPRPMHPILIRPDNDLLRYEAARLAEWHDIPNIVPLLDQQFEHDPPYIVLQLLGKSLDESVPDGGMEVEEILQALYPITIALEKIHMLNDAHFDVNPQNILLDPRDNKWKLIDPCWPECNFDECFSRHLPDNWERDILALGRTFLYAYRGLWADKTLLPEERPILDPTGKFEQLLDRMLCAHSSPRRPTAKQIRRMIEKSFPASID